MRHPTKHGTMVADDKRLNKQIVKADDGEVFYLTYGVDAARGAKVGDRIELNYIATRSLGLWYGRVDDKAAEI